MWPTSLRPTSIHRMRRLGCRLSIGTREPWQRLDDQRPWPIKDQSKCGDSSHGWHGSLCTCCSWSGFETKSRLSSTGSIPISRTNEGRGSSLGRDHSRKSFLPPYRLQLQPCRGMYVEDSPRNRLATLGLCFGVKREQSLRVNAF